jgi:hypothetical protein
VKRLPCILPLIFLIFVSVACGNISIRGAIQPGIVSGLVSVVQLTEVGVANGTVQVTFVTFLLNGTSSVIGFCGDQRSLFPMDQTIRAQFDQGQTCNNIIQITIT